MRLHCQWCRGYGYLVYNALDDGDAAGPDSVQGEEDVVSLDWDDSTGVSRHVLLLTIQSRGRQSQLESSLTWTEWIQKSATL